MAYEPVTTWSISAASQRESQAFVTNREVADDEVVLLPRRVSRVRDEEWKEMLATLKQMEAKGPLPLFRDDADAKVEQFRETHGLKPSFPLKNKLYEICAEQMQLGLSRSPKDARTTIRVKNSSLGRISSQPD